MSRVSVVSRTWLVCMIIPLAALVFGPKPVAGSGPARLPGSPALPTASHDVMQPLPAPALVDNDDWNYRSVRGQGGSPGQDQPSFGRDDALRCPAVRSSMQNQDSYARQSRGDGLPWNMLQGLWVVGILLGM